MKTQDKETPSKIAEPASLKEAREKLGKTQGTIAKEVGYANYMFVSHIENGKNRIPKPRIESFAKAYGVSVEQLGKLWVKKPPFSQQLKTDGNMDVLPTIKAIAGCGISSPLSLKVFLRLLEYTAPLQNRTSGLIKEILICGFK